MRTKKTSVFTPSFSDLQSYDLFDRFYTNTSTHAERVTKCIVAQRFMDKLRGLIVLSDLDYKPNLRGSKARLNWHTLCVLGWMREILEQEETLTKGILLAQRLDIRTIPPKGCSIFFAGLASYLEELASGDANERAFFLYLRESLRADRTGAWNLDTESLKPRPTT